MMLALAATVLATAASLGPPPPPPPKMPTAVTISTGAATHQISPLAMGCHSDSGYAHQARGFYSQMIVGESFNATGYPDGRWNTEVDPSATFTAEQSPTEGFHGVPSELLSYTAGTGVGGVSNRGLGNAGMVLEAGKQYEGFLFAKLPAAGAAGPVTVTLTLENFVTKAVLASKTISVAAGGADFARYNFSLAPTEGTSCVDIVPAAGARSLAIDSSPRMGGYLSMTCVPVCAVRRVGAIALAHCE
eukprot:SAG22_NODE_4553_length_1236_cov_1.618294_2_plen_246_part_00